MIRKQHPIRRILCFETLEARLCPSSLPLGTPLSQPDAASQAHLSQAYDQLPLSFEANRGQVDPQVNFLSQGSGYTLFLTRTEAVLALQQPASNPGSTVPATSGAVLRMQLVGANPAPAVAGLDPQASKTNYFIGSDPTQWHTDIANYGKVQYRDVYTGVDLVYYGNQRQLEYDFVVAPGADPKAIRLAFQGAKGMAIDTRGDLVLHTSGDDVVEKAPVLYQDINGVRQAVSGHYELEGNGQVGFQIGSYDSTRTLIIDPVYALVYSTYLGGNGGSGSGNIGYGIAVDSSGDAYVTGLSASTEFPTTNGAFDTTGGGGFVTKFSADGSVLLYSTFLGGAFPQGIAVDSSGNAYVSGYTSSTNFPTKNPLQATYGGGGDAFVTKLNATGSALVYSTYLGGSSGDQANGIAVDSSGNAYVTGSTNSTNFPTTPGSLEPVSSVGRISFVAKLNASGSALLYSTYLATSSSGASGWNANGIAVDGSGNAYVTGVTLSTGFPTTPGAFQTALAGGYLGGDDAFVMKLNATGSALVYSTFLGGIGMESGYRIAVDGSGNAWVAGLTKSTDFPTTAGAFQTTFGGGYTDAFVTGLNAAGSALVYSTYLGGSGDDTPNHIDPLGGIAVDSSGNVYVTGITGSTNFPTKNALQATFGGGQYDAFVAEFNPSQVGAASLLYATYLGGSDQDESYGIAVDGSGNAYVTGTTGSANFPTKNAYQPNLNYGNYGSAFVTKIGIWNGLVANAGGLGGLYSINQGNGLTLNGSGSSDPDGDPLTYSWDVNGDGIYGDATGVSPTLSWAQFQALGITAGIYNVHVQIDDGHGDSAYSPASTLTVISPAIASLTGPADGFHGVPGQARTFTFGATSSDPNPQFTYFVTWGDATSETDTGSTGLQVSHIFQAAGHYTVTLTATDASGHISAPLSLSLTMLVTEQQGATLAVGGTAAADSFLLATGKTKGTVNVTLNGTNLGAFTTSQVLAYGGAGNDTLTGNGTTSAETLTITSTSVAVRGVTITANAVEAWTVNGLGGDDTFAITGNGLPVSLNGGADNDTFKFGNAAAITGSIDGGAGSNTLDYSAYTTGVTVNLATGSATGVSAGVSNILVVRGGAGNDNLTGNAQGNILIGLGGNDVLTGGSGRSILVGGRGADTVTGGSGDDILIAGNTTYDSNTTALLALFAEWGRTDETYQQRIDHLRGTVSGGLNGSYDFNASTVKDDGVADKLTGGSGMDWFWANLSKDTISDLATGELVN